VDDDVGTVGVGGWVGGAGGGSRARDLLITNCPDPGTQGTRLDLSVREAGSTA
jgi:hypothetical protein